MVVLSERAEKLYRLLWGQRRWWYGYEIDIDDLPGAIQELREQSAGTHIEILAKTNKETGETKYRLVSHREGGG